MMGETLRFIQSNKKLELRISATQNLPKGRLLGSFSKKTLQCFTPMKVSLVASGDMGVFFLTSAVLEIVRRFSSAHYPLIWRGLHAAQILCCPPFRWIQKWAPFTGLVKGIETLSRPLRFLSVATGSLGESGTSKETLIDWGADADVIEVLTSVDVEDRLVELYQELDKEGITIPDRLNEDELRRFYDVADGDFAKFLSSVKKTIQWRQTYTFLSQQELQAWGNLVFWHGSDVMQRPSLVIRIGLAGRDLDPDDHAQFVRAVVSQVEHGVVNLVDAEHPQLTVLLDCDRLPPFKFPLQTYRSCVSLLQDRYPNRLGCLLVVRVPPVAQVMTQTLSQDLKPRTKQKLTIVGEVHYRNVLLNYFEELPHFPPSKADKFRMQMERNETIAQFIMATFFLFLVSSIILAGYYA